MLGKFKEFVAFLGKADQIKKRTILEFFSDTDIDFKELTKILNTHFKDALISESPVSYDFEKFAEIANQLDESEKKEKTEILNLEKNFDIDASQDSALKPLIKTKSYEELEELLVKDIPLNIYIAGETGLGKSSAVLDIAKKIGKQVVRVGMSSTTDIDDLIGGIRIVDGTTVFDPGPVAIAMTSGSILLLDEVDFASPRILVELHPVLEGKGVLAKKLRKMIYPSSGFCVVATGNTKGVGDSTGKYLGTNNLNHAFLERFGAAIEFKPPTKQELELILRTTLPELGYGICKNLCGLYEAILSSYNAGGIDEYLHVRKMIDIAKLALIFGIESGLETDMSKVIKRGLSLKEEHVIVAVDSLYLTIKKSYELNTEQVEQSEPSKIDEDGNEIPF